MAVKVPKNPRVKKPTYRCEEVDPGVKFQITKIDVDGETEMAEYEVVRSIFMHHGESHVSMECNCYAGNTGKHCRHKQVVELFEAHNKVGSIAEYCFDHRKWI